MVTSSFLVLVGAVLSLVLAAPVEKTKLDDITAALKAQIQDQEQALESLAALPDKDAAAASGVGILRAQAHTYSNVNGAAEEHESHKQTVSDLADNHVISDVSEHVDRQQQSPESELLDSFRASVDVPSQGVHQEISDTREPGANNEWPEDDNAQTVPGDLKNTIEFTPEEMAKYLLATGETEEFKEVLNDLVDNAKITAEQAEEYEKNVFDEYFKLAQDEALPGHADTYPDAEAEDLYPQYLDQMYPDALFPAYNGAPQQQQDSEEVLPLYSAGPSQPLDETNMNSYINYLLNRPVTLDEMISTLLEEWLTRAVVTGDPEALAIMGNIVDYVSTDDNPNDEEQVREILGDIFADALLEDLTPRVGPQPIPEMPESSEMVRDSEPEPEADSKTTEEESTETDEEAQIAPSSEASDVKGEDKEEKMKM